MTATVVYPRDITGTSPANRITREPHVVTEVAEEIHNVLVLNFSPFFPNDFVLETEDGQGGYAPMVLGVDYEFVLPWYSFEKEVGKYVYGGVKLHRKPTTPMIFATYQTLGDYFSADRRLVMENLANYVWGPRIAQWDQVTNVQENFPPNQHTQDLQDFTKWDAVAAAINKLTEKFSDNRPISLLAQREIILIREGYDILTSEVRNYRSEVEELRTRLANLERRIN